MSEAQMTDLRKSVAFYGNLLSQIATPEFSLPEYPYADKRSHAWKVIENGGSSVQVEIIELKPMDFLMMSPINDCQKTEYLRKRFKPFFNGLRKNIG